MYSAGYKWVYTALRGVIYFIRLTLIKICSCGGNIRRIFAFLQLFTKNYSLRALKLRLYSDIMSIHGASALLPHDREKG